MNSTADHARARWARRLKARTAPVLTAAAVLALTASIVLGGAAPNADAAAAGTPPRPAVPEYYMALPGGNNFANVPGSPTAVVRDTVTGKLLLTVRPSGKDKFVSVSAAADDRTFILGANPNLSPPAIPMPTDWYLVHITPGPKFSDTIRKLRITVPGNNVLADATALSPDGSEVALVGLNDNYPQPTVEWLRIYSVATGALLREWSGDLNVVWDGYTTLSWTSGGHQLAIGYTYWVTPAGSKKSWLHIGVRTLDLSTPGHNLLTDTKLVWSRLGGSNFFTTPKPLNCYQDIRVLVSANGTVVCAATGLLRVYNSNPTGPVCPKVAPWLSLGFLAFSTTLNKQATVYKLDTNCNSDGLDVLWTNATGTAVIGYYSLGLIVPGGTDVLRFGVFADGKYTPLPVPPTIESVPDTIAW